MNNDGDQQRALALQDAHRLLRQAQAAIAAAATSEPSAHRLERLQQLHAVVADARADAERLQQ